MELWNYCLICYDERLHNREQTLEIFFIDSNDQLLVVFFFYPVLLLILTIFLCRHILKIFSLAIRILPVFIY